MIFDIQRCKRRCTRASSYGLLCQKATFPKKKIYRIFQKQIVTCAIGDLKFELVYRKANQYFLNFSRANIFKPIIWGAYLNMTSHHNNRISSVFCYSGFLFQINGKIFQKQIIYLDHKFQYWKEGLNCQSLAYEYQLPNTWLVG